MHRLMDYICDELEDLEKKADNGGLSKSEIQYGDVLAHFGKNLDKMMEREDDYSERYVYDDGRMMRDGSYARGRRNARRDAMGRYSREGRYRPDGYSRDDARQEYADKMRRMMEDAPDEQTRQSIHRMIQQIEKA